MGTKKGPFHLSAVGMIIECYFLLLLAFKKAASVGKWQCHNQKDGQHGVPLQFNGMVPTQYIVE
jgi:hypothetical protein